MKNLIKLFSIIIFFSIFSCASNVDLHSAFVYDVKNGNYELVYSTLEQSSKNYYSNHDDVLQMLDLGLLAHYSDFPESSINYLNRAESLIEENFSKSITQNISSYILNDNVIDYAGEEYEDIYVNLFKCLTFISQENYESAFVEIRRFNNKLKSLSVKYQEQISKIKKESQMQDDSLNSENYKVQFYDSVFARYLSMLLYLYEGDVDSAKIDYNYLVSAFDTQKKLYNFSFPKQIEENFYTTKNDARLNVVAFSGMAPRRKEESISNIYYGYKIALPVMYEINSEVDSIKLVAINQDTKTVYQKDFEKIESISNIAVDTFKQKQSLIYTKSLARSLMKSVTTDIFKEISEEAENSDTAALFELLHFTSLIANQITEVADIRTSKYFPSSVFISGIDLPVGNYDIIVTYFSSDETEVSRKVFNDYDVSKDKLNLLEAVCLK
jgi:hypothetical protein